MATIAVQETTKTITATECVVNITLEELIRNGVESITESIESGIRYIETRKLFPFFEVEILNTLSSVYSTLSNPKRSQEDYSKAVKLLTGMFEDGFSLMLLGNVDIDKHMADWDDEVVIHVSVPSNAPTGHIIRIESDSIQF